MKLQEGPAFGALIIGVGVGYLVYQKTQNMTYALGAGVCLAVVDYFVLLWIGSFKKK